MKLTIELQKFKKIHNKIIQKQLQMKINVIKKMNKQIPKEKYISPEERQKNIDDLRLI